MDSFVIHPGLRITGTISVKSMIVDSTPTITAPPSKIIGIFPWRSSMTCSAFVGLGRPDVFALGAAIGTPDLLISSNATGWSGIRIATVSSPPVTQSGTWSAFCKITVIGPGQKCSIARLALSGISLTRDSTICISHTWRINGLSEGLPFAA